jgi:hypothetical protein
VAGFPDLRLLRRLQRFPGFTGGFWESALARVDDNERLVLQMRRSGCLLAEIAVRLGISLPGVSRMILGVRQRLCAWAG